MLVKWAPGRNVCKEAIVARPLCCKVTHKTDPSSIKLMEGGMEA